MTATCDFCESAPDTSTRFDSHDGGQICILCDKTFCPACEQKHFTDKHPDICKACVQKEQS